MQTQDDLSYPNVVLPKITRGVYYCPNLTREETEAQTGTEIAKETQHVTERGKEVGSEGALSRLRAGARKADKTTSRQSGLVLLSPERQVHHRVSPRQSQFGF